MGTSAEVTGPDFTKGVSSDLIQEGETLLGHVGDKAVLLIMKDGEYYAISAKCPHYGGPLNEGIITGETIHCPWHHSAFNIKTGALEGAPALKPVSCWFAEVREDKIFITAQKHREKPMREGTEAQHFVIIGAGASGTAAAVQLRRLGFLGKIHLLSADDVAPYDRPNLSKDYLAGNAPEEWLPLFNEDYYRKHDIILSLGVQVEKIDPHRKHLKLSDGRTLNYDKCLLATGGIPIRLPIPGADSDHVFLLRSLKDCRNLIDRATWSQKVAIIGAGFIGLEAAASLRERNLEVHVIAPEQMPLMKVIGVHAGHFVKRLHETHGVHFHLEHGIKEIRDRSIVLDDKTVIDCDFVLMGAGIKPNTALAEQAGCAVDKGVLVNEYLESSVPDIYAAGDIACWPDQRAQRSIRVEHWEVAERQGMNVAMNMLGDRVRFHDVPFFWTQHYDVPICYVGHSDRFDRMDVFGDIESKDFAVVYYEEDRIAAFLTVGRDKESLMVEDAFAHFDNKRTQEIISDFERHLKSKSTPLPNYFEPSP